jgi:hypothetical protein
MSVHIRLRKLNNKQVSLRHSRPMGVPHSRTGTERQEACVIAVLVLRQEDALAAWP